MIKLIKLIFVFIILITSFLHGQNFEARLSWRYGTPTQFFKEFQHPDPLNETNLDLELSNNIFTVSDVGVLSSFNYKVLKKWNIFSTIGLEYSRSNFYKEVKFNNTRLDVISFNYERISAQIGGFKRFDFYDNRLSLDLGFNIQKRFFLSDDNTFKQDLRTAKYYDYYEYEYSLTTYHDGYYTSEGFQPYTFWNNFHLELNAKLAFRLYKNIDFVLGFDYNRNHVFYYDFYKRANLYKKITTHEPDGTISVTETIETMESQPYIGENGAKRSVRSHFLYLNFGLSWRF